MTTVKRIQHRRGTAAEWTAADPVLAAAEPAYETDTGKQKIGDGTTAWTVLAYAPTTGGGGSGSASDLTSGTLPAARIADGSLVAAKMAPDVATQAELDAVASAKANVSHLHTSVNISDFTEAVQDVVGGLLGAGSNVILNYDDAANALTISATGAGGAGLDAEQVRDAIGVALVGVGNIAVTVNDAADTITISTTATVNATDAALRDRASHTGTQGANTVSGLAAVATSGAYADLSGRPTIPAATTDASALTSGILPSARIADGSVAAGKLAFDPATQAELDTHTGSTANPHSVTKAQVGLGSVPNVDATARANHSGTQAVDTITGLASVAATGAYGDLSGKPSIPAATTDASALTSGTLPAARIADGSLTAAKMSGDVATQAELDAAVTALTASIAALNVPAPDTF